MLWYVHINISCDVISICLGIFCLCKLIEFYTLVMVAVRIVAWHVLPVQGVGSCCSWLFKIRLSYSVWSQRFLSATSTAWIGCIHFGTRQPITNRGTFKYFRRICIVWSFYAWCLDQFPTNKYEEIRVYCVFQSKKPPNNDISKNETSEHRQYLWNVSEIPYTIKRYINFL